MAGPTSLLMFLNVPSRWFKNSSAGSRYLAVMSMAVHLWVYVAVHQKQVEPAIVVEVEECIAPAHVGRRGRSDAGSVRNIGKTHLPVVAE